MSSRIGVVMVLAGFVASVRAADWPRWRGPAGDGHVPAGIDVPKALPADAKVLWRVKIGDGLSSPIVSGGKVFYVDNQQGQETIHAADAASGKELWYLAIDEAFKDQQTAAGPRCTPVADGDRVYAQSCRGELQCLSAADGKVIWRVNFVKDFGAVFIGERGSAVGASRHGYNGSPVVDGDRIIAGVGGRSGASVVCFNKLDGKVIWKSQNDVPGYSGPVIASIAGVKQVISFTSEAVVGLDAKDGALFWREPVKTSIGRHVTTPVIVDDTVLVASHQAGLIAIRITRDGTVFKAQRAWTARELAINFSSPVAVGRNLFGIGPSRNLMCVDVDSGKLCWSKEAFCAGNGGNAYAAFVVMGENVMALTDGGQLVLFAANPAAYREVGRAQVCGKTWCNPAYADGNVFLRDFQELRCLKVLP